MLQINVVHLFFNLKLNCDMGVYINKQDSVLKIRNVESRPYKQLIRFKDIGSFCHFQEAGSDVHLLKSSFNIQMLLCHGSVSF